MKSKGFSLVELSIVLIIIGLLVSGAVSGSKLIETTRINNIINQISEMRTSASNYLLVYNALPGDHSNATDYWGTASNCYADTTGTSETCDGDGSGKLSYVNWIELIRFKETRNYVQRVLENINVYKYMLNKEPVKIDSFFN